MDNNNYNQYSPNHSPNNNSRYNGNAFWNSPQSDVPPSPVNTPPVSPGYGAPQDNTPYEQPQPQTGAPMNNVSFNAHPVMTPQKTASSMSTKKLVIIIVAAAVVITAITGVVIFALTSGLFVKTPEDQSVVIADATEAIVSDSDNKAVVEMISMPACENKSFASCKTQLEDLGLAVKVQYEYSSDVADGYVISQSVVKGTELQTGAEVTLFVSKGAEECPYDYQQKLTVSAAPGSSRASADLYEWENGDWQRIASYNAAVGSNGIGAAREGSSTSPEGLHKLGVVLSSGSVSTNLDTYDVTSNTCVVDDTGSSYYNQIMERGDIPAGVHYDNIGKGLTNGTTYATIYIEHNGNGFSSNGVSKGSGSAIGLRGQYGSLSATYGDVDITAGDMKDLLSRLDANKCPMIELITE